MNHGWLTVLAHVISTNTLPRQVFLMKEKSEKTKKKRKEKKKIYNLRIKKGKKKGKNINPNN